MSERDRPGDGDDRPPLPGGDEGTHPAPRPEDLGELLKPLVGSLELVILTRDRVQAAVDDAVERGRMTRKDATDLVTALVSIGQRQTEELLADLQRLVVASSSELMLREVDRVRRVAGLGPSFPITGYDDLTAAEVTARLGELAPADLRKVRDYERRNANRKTVLAAIDHRLD
jgi:polyhydroxyalkanoate synthesis regulator phasin